MHQELSREDTWIIRQGLREGQNRIVCPHCVQERKNKRDTPLSVEVTAKDITYRCWHCGATGHIWRDGLEAKPAPVREVVPLRLVAGELSDRAAAFLAHRGISRKTCDRAGLFSEMRYFRKVEGEAEGIAFPYMVDGEAVGVKHRCIEPKDYSFDGSATSLWNIDKVQLENFDGTLLPLIICEGEMDALTAMHAGVANATSVPTGAPLKVKEGRVDPKDDKTFAYLWRAKDQINKAQKVILCTDADEPGHALAEEIARRVGKAKCWTVEYPDECKDLNDVLLKHGSETVQEIIDRAVPWPVAGLFGADHYKDRVLNLYAKGPGQGEKTGFSDIDEIYSVSPGMVTVVTGIPGSGKSEFFDAVMYNLARNLGWKFGVCSFENPPSYHIPKLAEKYTGKPFFDGPTTRMSASERDGALTWINEHFAFIDHADGEPSTIESILERAATACLRLGIRGLIIDPFNYIEMPKDDTETNEISSVLTKLKFFAVAHDLHVWFVAHPTKMRAEGNSGIPVPKGYDISGSAAWFGKADFGVTVARPWMHSPLKTDEWGDRIPVIQKDDMVEVHVWKVRFKWMGKVGSAKLEYNPVNGIYTDVIDWSSVQI